jgi:hypothetical protein
MRGYIELQSGATPWQPSHDAELVETLLYNNMPIVGVVHQNDEFYLFRCVEGFADTTHVWAYTPITEAALEFLRKSKDVLWSSIDQVTDDSRLTIALATDEDGILLGMDLRKEKGVSILDNEAIISFLLRYGNQEVKKGSRAERAVRQLEDMTSPA